jgi:transcriptional regulator with XRE-family HTH domain
MTTNNSGATVRKVLGRSQKDFAEQCGLDRTYFGGVERGERNLTFFSLCEICAGLTVTSQLSLEEFLYREPLRSSRNSRDALPH